MTRRKHVPLLALALLGTPVSGQTINKPDRVLYTKGTYSLYLQPWSTFEDPKLVAGLNFKDMATISPTDFPAKTKIAWRWPQSPRRWNKPYGYMALMYGNYASTPAQKPIKPIQIKNLNVLTAAYRFTYSVSFGEFNVLAECFLTAQPGGNNKGIKEIGFFSHAPKASVDFATSGKAIGIFTDATGRKWSVHLRTPFYMFLPVDRTDLLKGRLDFKGAFNFLRAQGELNGDEWFNGLGFGVEPLSGSGAIDVRHFRVDQR